ncbi:Mth938-like domain-containing protein [Acidimangrovimonas pyrenivorans]|uniref:Mth938-like domain-containing protein n=1 Tax=Acidimangrovimonas pyrenivorans TaxID=2030798 RepID=A0ABV7AIF2_9RHOB
MRMKEIDYSGAAPIDGYGPGFFRIGGAVHQGPQLVDARGVTPWAGLEDRAPLLALAGAVDVLFVGMGEEIAHLPAPLRTALEEAGIGVEVMATPAACRSYNVLLAEGRRIAVALLPVGQAG